MPSFFRRAEDVRIFFLNETDTPEKKRQYSRLQTIFAQSVRRAGAKGAFFFHRRSSSLNNQAVLILEPQGPIDRGIFQEGLTRFGETLFGTFHTPRPGYLVLETQKNVSDSNINKYRRDIRRLIASKTGMMASGGDDRIQIITPAARAQAARARAAEQRQTAEASRAKLQKIREDRAARRSERKESDRARTPRPDPESTPQEKAARAAERTRQAAEQRAVQAAGVELVQEQWQDQLIAWSQEESQQHHLEADRLEAQARIDALEAREALLNHLKYQLAAIQAPDSSPAEALNMLAQSLADEPMAAGLLQTNEEEEEEEALTLDAAQAWLLREQHAAQEARAERQDDIARVQEIAQTLSTERMRMERARQQAVRTQAEQIRDRIRRAQADAEQARASADPDALAEVQRASAEAQAALMVINRLQRADDAMRWIENSLQRMEQQGQTSPEDLARQMTVDFMLRQSMSQLAAEVKALHTLGAASLTDALWDSRPTLRWAKSMLEDALR